jgi:histidyl-tRNA synthetase
MRDFLPAEKAHRERVLQRIRSVYRAHGFDEIETPVVEDSSRLHAGLGGDNEKLAFAVMKRGLTTDALAAANSPLDLADLGLRFDLTVPLARFYASHRGQLPGVFRAIQIAPVWRAERPQKGRYRQFVQCDIDIIGEPGVLAEAELLSASLDALGALGVPGCSIRLNDRRLLAAILDAVGVAPESQASVLITLDKLDKLTIAEVVDELRDNGHGAAVDAIETMLRGMLVDHDGVESIANARFASVEALLARLPEQIDPAVAQPLRDIVAALPGAPIELDPFLVRGMGYYTGPIFEIAHPDLPYSLGGGGRYDGMIGRFLGTDVPACGFSLGFERLIDLVELGDEADDASALLYDADVELGRVIALKNALVEGGSRVRVLARPKNMKAALEQLETEGFTRFAVIARDTPDDAATLDWRRLTHR